MKQKSFVLKSSQLLIPSVKSVFVTCVFVLSGITFLSSGIYAGNTSVLTKRSYYFPDSVDIDSPEIVSAFGDTVQTIIDGVDTIYVISEGPLDTIDIEARGINTSDIIITLTNTEYPVNKDIFGVNLEGFFAKYTNTATEIANYEAMDAINGYEVLNPYAMLAEMSPKILRFPSGASSKFQHPLGSANTASFISVFNAADPSHAKTGLRNGGFGYDLEEIIRYYDRTNPILGDYGDYEDIIIDMLDNTHIDDDWLEEADKADFESFYNKWVGQPSFNAADYTVAGVEQIWNEPLYINNFIDLISYIETTKGYVVDVISAINILSEPA